MAQLVVAAFPCRNSKGEELERVYRLVEGRKEGRKEGPFGSYRRSCQGGMMAPSGLGWVLATARQEVSDEALLIGGQLRKFISSLTVVAITIRPVTRNVGSTGQKKLDLCTEIWQTGRFANFLQPHQAQSSVLRNWTVLRNGCHNHRHSNIADAIHSV